MNERLLAAVNRHDVDALAGCFAKDYRSEQPAHPRRSFSDAVQVRENWSAVFAGVPDFSAELLSSAVADDVEIGEWRWHGTHTDGAPFEMRGTTVFGVVEDRIAWGRLYMEPVELEGAGIEEMVRETYRPPTETQDQS